MYSEEQNTRKIPTIESFVTTVNFFFKACPMP